MPRHRTQRVGDVAWLVAGVSVAWAAAAALAVFVPELVTGTDPTHLPIAAVIEPIAAMVITSTACQLFSSLYPDGKQEALAMLAAGFPAGLQLGAGLDACGVDARSAFAFTAAGRTNLV